MAPEQLALGSGTFWLRQYSSRNSGMRSSDADSTFSWLFHPLRTIGESSPSWGERMTYVEGSCARRVDSSSSDSASASYVTQIAPMRCRTTRSEEHTSELQSLMRISYAVFCLKKKKKNIRRMTSRTTTKTEK